MKEQRTYFDVASQIVTMLKDKGYKENQKLPPERELSENFSVSRGTIREALVMLEVQGLIEVKKGSGVYYLGNKNINSSNENYLSSLIKSDVGPFELIKAREIIETSIIEYAATQIRLEDLRKLKEIIDLQEKDINLGSKVFEARDKEFHEIIAKSTQNTVLINLQTYMWSSARTNNPIWQNLNVKYLQKDDKIPAAIEGHRKIYIALQRRDPIAARKALLEHLDDSRQNLIEGFKLEGVCLDDYEDSFFLQV